MAYFVAFLCVAQQEGQGQGQGCFVFQKHHKPQPHKLQAATSHKPQATIHYHYYATSLSATV
jgi:hypothetical protein